MRGLFEFDIDGKKRGFLVNFYTLGILEERLNKPIDEILDAFKTDKKGPKVKLLLEVFYAGALNYCEEKGIVPDFTINTVSEWVMQVGLDKASKIITEALSSSTPKNSSPHQEAVGM
jgi:hypothetical protein